ncbi:MAG: ROK family protein [Ginsengibacter sp.]|jgi:polyphosphate glucokinase
MTEKNEKILSIDIGGTHIKATILDNEGKFLKEYEMENTPQPSSPEKVMAVIQDLAKHFPEYDKIAAGFPGVIKEGVVKTAPKLGNSLWKDYDLCKQLESVLGKPTLLINDADLQGLSLATGKGVEMVITLGTGFGSAILRDGILMPHLELSVHPITKSKSYNDYVGKDALKKIGKKKWNKRMEKVIDILKTVFNYDHLYISGGNARLLTFNLDQNISLDDNKEGIKGGAILWKRKETQV